MKTTQYTIGLVAEHERKPVFDAETIDEILSEIQCDYGKKCSLL